MPDVFWAYFAGFLDADGCIGIYKQTKHEQIYHVARVIISQKDREVLDYFRSVLKTGWVSKCGKTSAGNTMHQLVFGSAVSREICRKVLPYLRIKCVKAQAVIDWKKKIHALAVTERDEYPLALKLFKQGCSRRVISEKAAVPYATISYWVQKGFLFN